MIEGNKKDRNPQGEDVFFRVVKTLLLMLLTLIFLFSTYRLYKKYNHSRRALVDTKIELEKLKKNEQNITDSIQRLSTPEGIEYEIRDRYRVVRPNEKLILIVDTPNKTQDISQKSVFEKIKEYLY